MSLGFRSCTYELTNNNTYKVVPADPKPAQRTHKNRASSHNLNFKETNPYSNKETIPYSNKETIPYSNKETNPYSNKETNTIIKETIPYQNKVKPISQHSKHMSDHSKHISDHHPNILMECSLNQLASPNNISSPKIGLTLKQTHPNRHRRNLSHGDQQYQHVPKQAETKFMQQEEKCKRVRTRNLFYFHHVIGRGGFGKVWKVESKRNNKIYALKEMSKAVVIAKKSTSSVVNERKLLGSLKSDFIVNMVQSFQDRETLYLVMDYLPGGDLRHHLTHKGTFTQCEAKFIIACIFLGLEFLHGHNIIHRDIKPENIVFGGNGYARITDLGVAQTFRHENKDDTSGTPGYMAPQVICGQNHSYSADHFALGVIAYELMLGRRPYYGRNRREIRDEIMGHQVQVKKHEIPEDWSMESADFVNRLLQRKQTSRLGYMDSGEIREHPWLRQYPWHKLIRQDYPAPFEPTYHVSDSHQKHEQAGNREVILQYEMLLREPQVQKFFKDYDSDI